MLVETIAIPADDLDKAIIMIEDLKDMVKGYCDNEHVGPIKECAYGCYDSAQEVKQFIAKLKQERLMGERQVMDIKYNTK